MRNYNIIIMGAGRSGFTYNIYGRYWSNHFYYNTENSECSLGTIQLIGKTYTLALKDGLTQTDFNKLFSIKYVSKNSIDLFITSENLPDPNNNVSVTDKGKIQLIYTQKV